MRQECQILWLQKPAMGAPIRSIKWPWVREGSSLLGSVGLACILSRSYNSVASSSHACTRRGMSDRVMHHNHRSLATSAVYMYLYICGCTCSLDLHPVVHSFMPSSHQTFHPLPTNCEIVAWGLCSQIDVGPPLLRMVLELAGVIRWPAKLIKLASVDAFSSITLRESAGPEVRRSPESFYFI